MASSKEVIESEKRPQTRSSEASSTARMACLILGLVTLLTYLPVQFYDYVYYDDLDYVTGNPAVQGGFSGAGIRWAFTTFHASNWHPVTWLSLMLDWELFGANPGAQHLVNVLIHAANAMLLLAFLNRTTGQLWPSAFAAALFAWHPLRVESVVWIAERKDVLCAFFGLLTLWFYAAYAEKPGNSSPSRRRHLAYGLALFCYALGLMAKPMLVTWPFVLLLIDYWPLRRWESGVHPARSSSGRHRFARLLTEKLPFLTMAVPVCWLTVLAQRQHAILSLENFPVSLRLANALMSYTRYLLKVIWPVDLTFSYPFPRHYASGQLIASAMLLLILSGWVWSRRKSEPFWLVGWLWYLGTLVPVIGLVQVGAESMADRYTYIPVMGVAAAVAFGAAQWAGRLAIPRTFLVLASSVTLGVLIALTQFQLPFWQNPTALLRHALALNPNNRVVHQVLGAYLYDEGQPKLALQEFQTAVTLLDAAPTSASQKREAVRAHQALAHDYQALHMDQQALAQYNALLLLAPDNADVHNDLANLLADMGRRAEALSHYQEAIRLKPTSPQPHENLGLLLEESGEFDASAKEFMEAAKRAPKDSGPRRLLAWNYLRQGDSASAVAQLRNALTLEPTDVDSMVYLARILAADEKASIRNEAEALRWAQVANDQTAGNAPVVLDTLGIALASSGQFDQAQKAVQAAIERERAAGNATAVSNLQSRLEMYRLQKPYREAFQQTCRGMDFPTVLSRKSNFRNPPGDFAPPQR